MGMMVGWATAGLAAEPVAYVLQPDGDGLRMTLRFTGDDDGRTVVLVPDRWAGQADLARAVQDLRAVSEGATVSGSGARRIVRHPKGADVELTWRMVRDFEGEVREDERYYRPLVGRDGVHLLGPSAWVLPGLDPDVERPLSLEWRDLPEGWEAADSWGHGPTRAWTGTLRELARGLFVAGPIELTVVDVDGRPLGVAWSGAAEIDREQLTADLVATVRAQRAFWRDPGADWFLVSVLGVGETCCTLGGTGLIGAFAAFLETDGSHDRRNVLHVLSHELFHAWNGVAMQPAHPEEQMYWFSEGFTEYGSRVAELRAGLVDLDTYAAEINQVLRAYRDSPALGRGSAWVRRRFWSDREAEKLPYRQGEILALNWQAALRAGGQSVDDVMRDLLDEGQPIDPPLVDAVVRRRLELSSEGTLVSSEGLDIGAARDIERHARRGEPIDVRADALGPCFALGVVPMPVFDTGFDVEGTTEAEVVRGVEPDGPAFAAGLRDGAALTALSMYSGDLTRSLTIGIREADGTERRLSFVPVRHVPVPELFLRVDEGPHCEAWFADPEEAGVR
jgi:predicted metalloprotease with PDZ domain